MTHRDRECPLCGSDTEIIGSTSHHSSKPERVCSSSNCNWGVLISASRGPSSGRRIEELEERVEQLEKLVKSEGENQ